MRRWCMVIALALLVGCGEEGGIQLPTGWEGYDLMVLIQPPGFVEGEINVVDVERGDVIEGVLKGKTGVVPNDFLLLDSRLFILASIDNSLTVVNFPSLQTSTVVKFQQNSNPWEMIETDGKIFVTLWMSHQVSVVDVKSLESIGVIDIPSISDDILPFPLGIAAHDGKIYVALSAHDVNWTEYVKPGRYAVLDEKTLSYLKTITVPVEECFNLQSIAFLKNNMIITCAGDWGYTQGGVIAVLDNNNHLVFSESLTQGIIPGSISVSSEGMVCAGSLMGGDLLLFDANDLQLSILHLKDSGFVTSCKFLSDGRIVSGVYDFADETNTNLFIVDGNSGEILDSLQTSGPVQDIILLQ